MTPNMIMINIASLAVILLAVLYIWAKTYGAAKPPAVILNDAISNYKKHRIITANPSHWDTDEAIIYDLTRNAEITIKEADTALENLRKKTIIWEPALNLFTKKEEKENRDKWLAGHRHSIKDLETQPDPTGTPTLKRGKPFSWPTRILITLGYATLIGGLLLKCRETTVNTTVNETDWDNETAQYKWRIRRAKLHPQINHMKHQLVALSVLEGLTNKERKLVNGIIHQLNYIDCVDKKKCYIHTLQSTVEASSPEDLYRKMQPIVGKRPPPQGAANCRTRP